MAKVQKLKITRPVTTNGRTQRIGEDGRVVVKVSYVPTTAMRFLQSVNATLEDGLKMDIKPVWVDTKTRQEIPEPTGEIVATTDENGNTVKRKTRAKISKDSLDEMFGK